MMLRETLLPPGVLADAQWDRPFAVLVEVQVRRAPVDTGDLENVSFATVKFRIITIAHVLEQAEGELDDSQTQESAAHARRLCTQQRPPVDVRFSQVDFPNALIQALLAQVSLYDACLLATKSLPRLRVFQLVARADDWDL